MCASPRTNVFLDCSAERSLAFISNAWAACPGLLVGGNFESSLSYTWTRVSAFAWMCCSVAAVKTSSSVWYAGFVPFHRSSMGVFRWQQCSN
eukprot:6200256-Pleurochrysis_carterae.AAC.2